MIPNKKQAANLLQKYSVPENKKRHLLLVAKTAEFLAERLQKSNPNILIDTDLLFAAALLHDIDKGVEKLSGEQHPDAAVRVLANEGMDEVAALVKNHPLHCILDPATEPKRWEEKILFLSDKMVKYDIVGVDARFTLWRNENMPDTEKLRLDRAYPKVKLLEREIFQKAHITDRDIIEFAKTVYTGWTEGEILS